MERLSALDAGFLELEDSHVAVHLGGAAVFAGPAPATEELIGRFEHVIARNPRYRQVLARAPLDVRRPRWRDGGRLDLDYHVRRIAIPAPGGRAQLEDMIALIMSARLDTERPLWEAWLIEGLQGDMWAVVIKVHHSVVDGVGGMGTLLDLLDPCDANLSALPVTSMPTAVSDLLHRAWRGFTAARQHPLRAPVSLVRTAAAVPRSFGLLRLAAPTSLNGALGRDRLYRTLSVDQADIRAVRHALGGTVNDVVLAMVARGFHDLLLARGDQPSHGAARCLVPVNVRGAKELNAGTNKITFVLVDLPTEYGDARDAYLAIRARVSQVKGSNTAGVVAVGFALANLVPSGIASAALAAFRRVPQRIVTTITTNVPGPGGSQSLLGHRMLALYPYVPIAERIRIAVAVTSYGEELHFGVTFDRSAFRHPDVFVAAMDQALRDLVKCAPSGE